MNPSLPIDEVLPELLDALRGHGCALLRAPTGAGKTTRVPSAILDAGLLPAGERVLVLEPRRLAARAAARRVASERGARLGDEVGYEVRFDKKSSQASRIVFITEGVMLRKLQSDPFLEGIGAVVFDEFHERSLDADLALALCRRVRGDAREDLRLVCMSATIDPEPIARYLGDAPVVESRGRLHPVDIQHLSPADAAKDRGSRTHPVDIARRAAEGVRRADAARSSGHVLCFLPGVGEIRRTRAELETTARQRGATLHELYGDLRPEDQDRVLSPSTQRKWILSTNVAEASVTIEGVTAVVDTGLQRQMLFEPRLGLDRLILGSISKASADQRAGRAGRTEPGICLRLWTELEHRALPEEDLPEIARVDLSRALLELAAFGERHLAEFDWLDAPPPASVERALELLDQLGAFHPGGGLSPTGQRLAELPAPPRLARLLDEGVRRGIGYTAALAAALLSERDPFERTGRRSARHVSDSDVLDRIRALEAFEERRNSPIAGLPELHRNSAKNVLRVRDQFARLVRAKEEDFDVDRSEPLARALLAAFPDRLCKRRAPGETRGVSVGGRGVRLAEESAVREAEFFVAVDLDGAGKEGLVRRASGVRREWLETSERRVELEWDSANQRVVALTRTRIESLILDESTAPLPKSDPGVEAILIDAAGRDLERALDLQDRDVRGFLERVRFLQATFPKEDWPTFDETFLRAHVLEDLCRGKRSFADLRRADLLNALKGALGWERLKDLDAQAPETYAVPSGSRLRLTYDGGNSPVLAARIQEMFGLAETPRVARGRVPVLVHLLAPNGRPQQVTGDLESFWNGAYHDVRRELRRRYPKHSWPEDPWNAQAQRRPKRRRP